MYTVSMQAGQLSESQKLKDRATTLIRGKLLSGDLPPGSRLSEVAMANDFGISRTPVREAMVQLYAEGLVDQLPRYGWFVRAPDRAELIELYELRELLESHAAACAASASTEANVADLKACVTEFRGVIRLMNDDHQLALDPQQLDRTTSLDLNFHETILRICGNSWVMKIAGQCRLISRLHAAKWRSSAVIGAFEGGDAVRQDAVIAEILRINYVTLRQHHQIYRAIRRHDAPFARQLMSQHIQSGLANVLRQVDGNPSFDRLPTALAVARRES